MGYGANWPIWNKVTNCEYNSNKSYGNKAVGSVEVLIGSSKSNSHLFVEHCVTRKLDKETDEWVFKFSVDGNVVKEARFTNNDGRAGDLIKAEKV